MQKAIKIITTGIILTLIFISIFTVLTHKASAWGNRIADLYKCRAEVLVEYDREVADSTFLPVDRKKIIPLTVNLRVVGNLADHVIHPYYDKQKMVVYFKIIEKPEWCTATIIPYVIEIFPTIEWKENYVNISILVDENAPAFSYGDIKIEVRVETLAIVEGGVFTHDIRFKPGYIPLLKFNIQEKSHEYINPNDEAIFNIEIENLGNAKTHIESNIIDIPEGWDAYIDPSIIIGASLVGDNPKRTLQLVVKPINNFGYYNEREIIQVSFIPSYYGDSSLEGKEYILSFIVESRGFTTPGFEFIFVILAFICIILVLKKHHKNGDKMKNKGGEK
jgi:hypothetical protein